MSCFLCFIGENLDIDTLVEHVGIPGFKKSYKGKLLSYRKKTYSKSSSASIQISDADFENLNQQIEDAQKFL